jgi:squalene-hopene/tetraprenyl-beta-curcumene cyclase
MRAILCWLPDLEIGRLASFSGALPRARQALRSGFEYLVRQQQSDGSWLPLWFGNQDDALEENRVYGTGRVLLALGELLGSRRCTALGISENSLLAMIDKANTMLLKSQNEDGGWGGGRSVCYSSDNRENHNSGGGSSTLEETAVALEGLMAFWRIPEPNAQRRGGGSTELAGSVAKGVQVDSRAPIMRGLRWLCRGVELGWDNQSQPIGFYFAKLWYHEQMYPLVFPLAALQSAIAAWPDRNQN